MSTVEEEDKPKVSDEGLNTSSGQARALETHDLGTRQWCVNESTLYHDMKCQCIERSEFVLRGHVSHRITLDVKLARQYALLSLLEMTKQTGLLLCRTDGQMQQSVR